jgi:hypothetical protein
MTNTEAADKLRVWLINNRVDPTWTIGIAIAKAITALEHQPEPDVQEQPHNWDSVTGEECEACNPKIPVHQRFLKDIPSGLECNVCHWRTLDTTRTLCDSCGSFELAPVSDIGQVKP